MIDHLELVCGCVFESGSWDVCVIHRKEGMMADEGPIPLSGFDEIGPTYSKAELETVRSIFNAASGRAERQESLIPDSERRSEIDAQPINIFQTLYQNEPYEASTRQARAERHSRKLVAAIKTIETIGLANHCPTCTCKKER